MSEHTACRIVGQPRGTQRYVPTLKPDENELTRNIVLIASNYGRYGYLRDELLNGEIFDSLREATVVIEQWRFHYNTKRPHSALG